MRSGTSRLASKRPTSSLDRPRPPSGLTPGYHLRYECVSTRPSWSTCYFGVVKAGQSSRKRSKPYECSSSAVSGPFSRSMSCTRSLGPKYWRCARSRILSRPWIFVELGGSRNYRTWTLPDALGFSLAAGYMAEYTIETQSHSRPSANPIPTA